MATDIMPIYIALDMSESMARGAVNREGKKRIEVAYQIIPLMLDAMRNNATFAESVRITLLGFNQDVMILLHHAGYEELNNFVERFGDRGNLNDQCKGQTYYSVLFRKLRNMIATDLADITAKKDRYFRPLVYFLTDGHPEGEDDERIMREYKALVGNENDKERYNPVIFCIGTGEVSHGELSRYGAGRNFNARRPNLNVYQSSNGQYAWQIKKDVDENEALPRLNELIIRAIQNSLIANPEDTDLTDVDFSANVGRVMQRPHINQQLGILFDNENLGAWNG